MQKRHPDGQYCIGQDSGIYWRITDSPEKGAEAPDWFYVGNVPPTLDGQTRRSYVLWREFIALLIALEFVSGVCHILKFKLQNFNSIGRVKIPFCHILSVQRQSERVH